MNIYQRKQRWKRLLLIAATAIGLLSLWYTNNLVKKLSAEEKKRVQLWAQATKQLALMSPDSQDFSFVTEVIRNNNINALILTDEKGNINSSRNLDSIQSKDSTYLKGELAIMRAQHEPIEIIIAIPELNTSFKNYIYYKDSFLLTQLRYYPIFQLAVITIFLLVAYFAFSTSRKAEQNQVWVGMAKETAHQLGTPISSLIAWVEYLKLKGLEPEMTEEVEKDINRLSTITERFSKIGSAPKLTEANIVEVVKRTVHYIQSRSSENIKFSVKSPDDKTLITPLNIPLFEWVIENICKNAIDAMDGSGSISVNIFQQQQSVFIDIKDSGKGIPKSKFKAIFNPGYTTKSRGWGLGLSLAKRIINEYHKGNILVKESEAGKGTTFRIVLK